MKQVKVSEIDQERFKWLEFYKIKFTGVGTQNQREIGT